MTWVITSPARSSAPVPGCPATRRKVRPPCRPRTPGASGPAWSGRAVRSQPARPAPTGDSQTERIMRDQPGTDAVGALSRRSCRASPACRRVSRLWPGTARPWCRNSGAPGPGRRRPSAAIRRIDAPSKPDVRRRRRGRRPGWPAGCPDCRDGDRSGGSTPGSTGRPPAARGPGRSSSRVTRGAGRIRLWGQAVRRRRVAAARISPRITHPPTTTRSIQNVEVGSAFAPTCCSASTA